MKLKYQLTLVAWRAGVWLLIIVANLLWFPLLIWLLPMVLEVLI